jgi:hypothetical protein
VEDLRKLHLNLIKSAERYKKYSVESGGVRRMWRGGRLPAPDKAGCEEAPFRTGGARHADALSAPD